MCRPLRVIRYDVFRLLAVGILICSSAGLHQVEAANDQNADNDSEARGAGIPGGGLHGFLSGIVDTPDDNFLRS
jgi:hypothetical protein